MNKVISLMLILSICSFAQMKLSSETENFIDQKNSTVLAKKSGNSMPSIYKVEQENKIFTIKKFEVRDLGDYAEYTPTSNVSIGNAASITRDEESIRALAVKTVNSLLPKEISQNIAITNVAFDVQMIVGAPMTEKVCGVSILFHRVLDGIAVRNGAFVAIDLDSLANVSEIRIKWPTYRKLLTSGKKKVGFLERHKQKRTKELDAFNKKYVDNGRVVKGEFDKAYLTFNTATLSNGTQILIPNVTYVGEINVDGDVGYAQMDIAEDESDIPSGTTIVFNR